MIESDFWKENGIQYQGNKKERKVFEDIINTSKQKYNTYLFQVSQNQGASTSAYDRSSSKIKLHFSNIKFHLFFIPLSQLQQFLAPNTH